MQQCLYARHESCASSRTRWQALRSSSAQICASVSVSERGFWSSLGEGSFIKGMVQTCLGCRGFNEVRAEGGADGGEREGGGDWCGRRAGGATKRAQCKAPVHGVYGRSAPRTVVQRRVMNAYEQSTNRGNRRAATVLRSVALNCRRVRSIPSLPLFTTLETF